MSTQTTGQAHDAKRKSQAAAARKPVNRKRAEKYPGKHNRNAWKRGI